MLKAANCRVDLPNYTYNQWLGGVSLKRRHFRFCEVWRSESQTPSSQQFAGLQVDGSAVCVAPKFRTGCVSDRLSVSNGAGWRAKPKRELLTRRGGTWGLSELINRFARLGGQVNSVPMASASTRTGSTRRSPSSPPISSPWSGLHREVPAQQFQHSVWRLHLRGLGWLGRGARSLCSPRR